jgi:lipopolysaccharide export system permease protein
MMNLSFFPSKRIALYMAKLFVLRSLAVLAALVIVLMALDLLGESGKILRVEGNGDAQLWHYVSLRIPQLIARFLPFSVLLGTLIALATLNQNSEIVSMKAAGISAHQIIAPLVLASLGIAALTFFFQERVVTRATAALATWQAVEYGKVPEQSGVANNVWVRNGDDLIFAASVSGRGETTRLTGVRMYDREGGTLVRTIEAPSGRPAQGGWLLDRPTLFNVVDTTATTMPSLVIARGVDPTQFTLANVDPDEQDFATLKDSIRQMEEAGRPTGPLQAGLWHKFLRSAVGGADAAAGRRCRLRPRPLGPARDPRGDRMALGFAYFVADNFALAMGNFGAYPPLLAAWAPFALFLLIGETVLIRTEE